MRLNGINIGGENEYDRLTCLDYALSWYGMLNDTNISTMIIELTDVRNTSRRHAVNAILFDYGKPYRVPWYYKIDRAVVLERQENAEPFFESPVLQNDS